MPILKPPPKQFRNATIQVRVEEDVDLKLRKYAEYIGSTPAFVVAESLKLLFHKDTEFREWYAHHNDGTATSRLESLTEQSEPLVPATGPKSFKKSTRYTANE